MGLPAGWEEEKEPGSSLPAGWEEEPGEDVAGKPEKPGHALGTFGVNALDALSVVGVPTVLAAKDAIRGVETAKGTPEKTDDDPRWKERSLLDRYRANKKVLSRKMQASNEEEPLAAVGGQLTAALVPGPKGSFIARGAATGALHGLLGGSADTAGGDVAGTAVDTALGAAGGALGEGVGAAAGRFTRWVGERAGKKFGNELSTRVRSLLGKYGQKKKDAVQAVKNLKLQEGMEDATQVMTPGVAGRIRQGLAGQFPGAEADLMDASAKNAAKEVRRFVGSQNRFGPSGIPDKQYAVKLAMRNMTSGANRALKDAGGALVRSAAGGAIGAGVASALGFNEYAGAATGGALAGASRLWALRKTAEKIMEHPRMLIRMRDTLPTLGSRMQTFGGNTGASVGYLTALLGTESGRRSFEAALEQEAAESDVLPAVQIPDEWRELEGEELDQEPPRGGEL